MTDGLGGREGGRFSRTNGTQKREVSGHGCREVWQAKGEGDDHGVG